VNPRVITQHWRRLAMPIVVIGAVAILTSAIEPAHAATKSASPAVASDSSANELTFSGVSCPHPHLCLAAGTSLSIMSATANAGTATWNGKAWRITPTPLPKNTTDSFLHDVSCTSAHACTAVGERDTPTSTSSPLIETWNGKAWKTIHAPRPAGSSADVSLSAVSCPTTHACVALGLRILGENNATSEVWNGTAWTVRAIRKLHGTTYSSLSGISCLSAKRCIAVGDYQVNNSSKSKTLVERWNGTSWSIIKTPNRKDGVNGDDLSGVSCSSKNSCIAIGSSSRTSAGNRTLVEQWNGKAWTIEASPNPKTAVGDSLQAVSCSSAHRCMAVGGFSGTSTGSRPLAERWNGRTWTIKALLAPSGDSYAVLAGVSCASPNACLAVGTGSDGGQAETAVDETWNGTKWRLVPAP
jgi:hypothetical protein